MCFVIASHCCHLVRSPTPNKCTSTSSNRSHFVLVRHAIRCSDWPTESTRLVWWLANEIQPAQVRQLIDEVQIQYGSWQAESSSSELQLLEKKCRRCNMKMWSKRQISVVWRIAKKKVQTWTESIGRAMSTYEINWCAFLSVSVRRERQTLPGTVSEQHGDDACWWWMGHSGQVSGKQWSL